MRLTTTIQVSVDGVMQGNDGRHENLGPGFERGGCTAVSSRAAYDKAIELAATPPRPPT